MEVDEARKGTTTAGKRSFEAHMESEAKERVRAVTDEEREQRRKTWDKAQQGSHMLPAH